MLNFDTYNQSEPSISYIPMGWAPRGLKHLLDVVPKLQDVGVLAVQAEQLPAFEVADLVIIVVHAGRITFIFMMEYILVVARRCCPFKIFKFQRN